MTTKTSSSSQKNSSVLPCYPISTRTNFQQWFSLHRCDIVQRTYFPKINDTLKTIKDSFVTMEESIFHLKIRISLQKFYGIPTMHPWLATLDVYEPKNSYFMTFGFPKCPKQYRSTSKDAKLAKGPRFFANPLQHHSTLIRSHDYPGNTYQLT